MAMIARLNQTVVLTALIACSASAAAQPSTFRTQFYPSLNATSWRTDFSLSAKCPSIHVVPRNMTAAGTFNALPNVRYTIIGHNGVRFEGRQGLFAFFAEEPTGNYDIIMGVSRIAYRHIYDDRQTWRAKLTSVVDGTPIVLPKSEGEESGDRKTDDA
jgi:hypothetical protein